MYGEPCPSRGVMYSACGAPLSRRRNNNNTLRSAKNTASFSHVAIKTGGSNVSRLPPPALSQQRLHCIGVSRHSRSFRAHMRQLSRYSLSLWWGYVITRGSAPLFIHGVVGFACDRWGVFPYIYIYIYPRLPRRRSPTDEYVCMSTNPDF